MRVLMCSPEKFLIAYEINPWMDVENQVNREKAHAQWQTLNNAYVARGVRVDLIEPQEGLPDMVFTANGGLVEGNVAVVPRFRFDERKGEEPLFKNWFARAGFIVKELPEDVTFEGQGEALNGAGKLFLGYGFRANEKAPSALRNILKTEIVPLELKDPRFYHLDTCFCPLPRGLALYYPGAFTPDGQKAIRAHFPRAVEVEEAAAIGFVCNSVPVGDELFLSGGAVQAVDAVLKEHGWNPLHFDMSEFRKSGGGARCLTLPLEE